MSESRIVNELHAAITEIRLQHEKVMQYYQRAEGLTAAGVEDFPALDFVLDGLIHYTIKCFDREEAMMKLVGYPRATEHLKSHDMFMRRLSGYRSRLLEGKYTANELVSLLKIWVTGHIEEQDRHFVDALQQVATKLA